MEQKECCLPANWREPKVGLVFLGIIILGAIIIVSILRDRIVSNIQNQVTVVGRGEVSYQPDTAVVNLGVQIDKAVSAEEALSKMNEKMAGIIGALEKLGIAKEDITTQNYSLYPQYDYKDGASSVSGYNANQQILVKVKAVDENPDNLNQVIAEAGKAGTNQVLGINFEITNLNDLKQEARIKAIEDAKGKAGDLAKAAGIRRLGKVVSWYENFVGDPASEGQTYKEGLGAGGASTSSPVSPNIPSGNQKIIIEMNVQYEVL
ncbi:MAG: SIMPL domain-containing protein [Patescibacteria group bacterium]